MRQPDDYTETEAAFIEMDNKITALTEINRLQSEECNQLQQDKAELREAISLVNIAKNMSNITGWDKVLECLIIKDAKALLEKHKCN